jgi:hypothetical protein
MLFVHTRNPKVLTINIVVFGIVGIVYFMFFALGKLNESLFHPLKYGWFGIWFSIVGGLSIFEYYKYRHVSLYKNSIYSVFYSVIYFFGFFIIPAMVDIEAVASMQMVWLGVLLIAYFVTFGALNWYFGIYIAMFNILIAVLTLWNNTGAAVEPVIWVSVFSFMGITNIYIQWTLVGLTTILGLLEKGFSMFDILE